MDETQIASILSAFDTKLATDPQIRAILRKITGGKATFADTADYAIRAGNLLGQFLSGEILDISPEDREVLCAALLKNRYTDLNKLLGTVQRAQDKPLGISLNPIKAPFPAERVQQVAHSLLDPGVKPEVIRRRANAPVATVAKSFHDDYIKINAQKRHDLGFKCYLTRVAVSGCCKWCTEIAGRYVYGDHPKDIFRRHDNCNCTVTFENGRQRQDVWSKRTWDANDPEEVMQNASEPTVYSEDQADQYNLLGKLRSMFSGQQYQDRIVAFAEQLPNIKNRHVARILRRTLEKTEFAQSPDKHSFYRKGKVYISKLATPSTIAHELFHRADVNNHIVEEGHLDNCLVKDYERLKNLCESTGQTLENMLYLKYQEAFSRPGKLKSDYRGISDIIEGMTDGGTRLGYGHIAFQPDYWKDPNALKRETFAQYGRMYFEENPAVMDMLKELFPDTTAKIDALIPSIAQFGR